MKIDVYSPSSKIYSADDIEYLEIPTVEGIIGVLDNHSPLISLLDVGVLKIKNNKNDQVNIVILSGFVKISHNHVLILADEAEMEEELVEKEIQKAITRVEKTLKEDLEHPDLIRLEKQIKYHKLRQRLTNNQG